MNVRTYSDEERASAIALILAGESVAEAARSLDAPYETVRAWWWATPQGALQRTEAPIKQPYDHAALWAESSARAARLIAARLDDYEEQGRELSPRELQHLAIVGGISTDKHLDYRDGRTKQGFSVDARSVNVTLTGEQAAALLAEAARHAAAELPPGAPTGD